MPSTKSSRTQGRRRRSVWVDDATWTHADALASRDAITVGHVLTALLHAYADGTLDVPAPEGEVRSSGRGQHPTTIADTAWTRADARRDSEGIQSMSVLCELLLKDYAAGKTAVGLTVSARPGGR